MKTIDKILIKAPWRLVFRAAAEVERWPGLLSHYRHVQVLSGRAPKRNVLMAAHRDGIPCQWTAVQIQYPAQKKIYYLHTRSRFTQGMKVWWIFKPKGPRMTEVLLTHDRLPAANVLRRFFDQKIIAEKFVHNIAAKTLAGLKRHLERP